MPYPYMPASRHGGAQSRIDRVVIHSTVGPSKPGSARGVARYFQRTTRAASAHYVVDAAEIIRCLSELVVGYHAPPNTGSIGIEICDNPSQTVTRWDSGDRAKALALAARLTGEVARRHGIPLVKLSPADLRAGKRGICGHVDVSKAFGQTDHWDPGAFPWSRFIQLVKGGSPQPEEDMPEYVSLGLKRDEPLTPDRWHTLTWDVEHSDRGRQHANGDYPTVLHGAAHFNAHGGVKVEGLPVGVDGQVRWFEVKGDKRTKGYPIREFTTSEGATFVRLDEGGYVDAGHLLRCEVAVFGNKPAKVTSGTLKIHYWRD